MSTRFEKNGCHDILCYNTSLSLMLPAIEKIFPCLLDLLAGEDYALRRAALIALSRLQGQAAADIILERYESDNLEDYLTVALSRIDPEKAAKALIAALSSPHMEARISAAEALIANPHDETIFALTSAVETYLNQSAGQQSNVSLVTEDALATAVRALGAIKSPMSVPLLRKVITKEGSTRLRATAVAALSNHMVDSLVPMIQALMKDPDPRVRANAIEALQVIDKPAIIGMLQPYLYDSHQRVRANAAKAIWKYGDYDVSTTLKEMLGHKEKAQRVSGIYAIGEIKADAFTKNLLSCLKDTDADVRRNAVIALRKFGKRDFSMDLIALIDDPVADVRIQAAAAITEVFQGTAQTPLLRRLGEEPEPNVRAAIIGNLGRIGNAAALVPLLNFLRDPEERVVLSALETIARLQTVRPTDDIIGRLTPFLTVKSRQVRSRAIRVLWQWGYHEVLNTILDMLQENHTEHRLTALDILGELFGEISQHQPDLREECETCLKAATERLRQDLKKKSSSELEQQVESLWQEASTHIQNSEFEQARSVLEHLLTLEPNHLQALIQLGEIYMRDKDDFQAESCFVKALELNPNTVKAHYCLGQIFHSQQDWERASKSLQTVIRLYPKLPQAYLWLADALEGMNRVADAREVLKRLQTIVPPHAAVLERLARLSFLTGQVTEAIAMARSAAAAGPLGIPGQLILSIAEHLSGNSAGAFKISLNLLFRATQSPDPKTSLEVARLLKASQAVLAAKEPGPSA